MLRRSGRHRLDPLVRSHRGIVWCKIPFLGPHQGIRHQADGFLGHLNSKERLDLLYPNSNSLGKGQILNNPAVRMVIIVASLAEVLHTSPGIVHVTRSLPKDRILVRTTKARKKSKLCKSGNGKSTLLLLLNFWRAYQS